MKNATHYALLMITTLLLLAGCDSSPSEPQQPEDATLVVNLELGDHDYNDTAIAIKVGDQVYFRELESDGDRADGEYEITVSINAEQLDQRLTFQYMMYNVSKRIATGYALGDSFEVEAGGIIEVNLTEDDFSTLGTPVITVSPAPNDSLTLTYTDDWVAEGATDQQPPPIYDELAKGDDRPNDAICVVNPYEYDSDEDGFSDCSEALSRGSESSTEGVHQALAGPGNNLTDEENGVGIASFQLADGRWRGADTVQLVIRVPVDESWRNSDGGSLDLLVLVPGRG